MVGAMVDWLTAARDPGALATWQDAERLPKLAACSGVTAVHRYSVKGGDALVTWVELEADDLLSQATILDASSPPLPFEGAASPERLVLQSHRDLGQADGEPAPWIYVVQADIPEALAREYNDWYDKEHLPRLVQVEGIRRARRFVALDGAPTYFTAYDLSAADSFETPAAVTARKTPWTEKMRGAFLNSRRSMLKRESPR
jgi:hypothetical protein